MIDDRIDVDIDGGRTLAFCHRSPMAPRFLHTQDKTNDQHAKREEEKKHRKWQRKT